MVVLHHLDAFLTEGLFHLDCVKELTRQPEKRILWPILEPVNRATINQRGEHTHSGTEVITDWTECQDYVQVLLALLDEETIQLGWSSLLQFALVFHDRTHHFDELCLLV
jgi:hypothetical protein